jgi:alpha-2-macroglobulin-like protein
MRTKLFSGIALLCFTLLFLGAKQIEPVKAIVDGLSSQFKFWNDTLPEDRVYVQCDKPFYSPGETIWFTAFVRDAATLRPSTKSDIVYAELINPKGSVEKKVALIAKNGLAPGDFSLDEGVPGGLYSLKVYTNWQKNDPAPAFFVKEIQVQDVVLPRLKMKLVFVKKAYGPGDKAGAELSFQTNENKPLTGYPLTFTASIAGTQFAAGSAKTDGEGKTTVTFDLPGKLTSSDGLLNVLCAFDNQTESISRSIPIVLNKISLSLFPEGGDLVAGLPSVVAFKAKNEFGKGADIDGYVTDNDNKRVAEFQSFHEGMGAFTLTPQEGKRYTAHLSRPTGISATYDLPEPMPQGYVLSVEAVTRDALTLAIGSTRDEELRIFLQMRGKEYFSKKIGAHKGKNEVPVDLAGLPIGVAQVTLFDAKGIERAERLVFVNNWKKMFVTIITDKERYLPREKVKMTITAMDETKMRMPGHFALAVTDDQLLSFADDKSSTILSTMLAEADVKGKIEEPRFYFDPAEKKAGQALDYLLMTQGWRRFTWKQITGNEQPAVSYPSERALIAGVVMDGETSKGAPGVKVKIDGLKTETRTDQDGAFSFSGIDLSESKTIRAEKGALQTEVQVSRYASTLQLWLYPQRRYVEEEDLDREMPMEKMAGLGGRVNRAPVPAVAPARMAKALPMPAVRGAGRAIAPKPMNMAAGQDKKRVAPVVHAQRQLARPMMLKEIRQRKKELAADERLRNRDDIGEGENIQQVSYYRAREFAAPDYKEQQQPAERTDFRSTIFWKGDVELGNNGSATVEFYASDAITSFRAITEGFSIDGGIGRGERVIYTQTPFSLSVKIPPVALTGDTMDLPLLIKNTTDKALSGELTLTIPAGLKLLGSVPTGQSVKANGSQVVPLKLLVEGVNDSAKIGLSYTAQGVTDAVVRNVKIQSQGFPVDLSFSGNELKGDCAVTLNNPVPRSVKASFRAYPSVVSDLLTGIESILQEPSGCFEQTSMSSYPNTLVLSYLKSSGNADPQVMERASDLLDKGYNRLTTFETKEKGYEWFGQKPGHEALTAYGLMQFSDMAKVSGAVNKPMVERTANWLMSRRDGKGGFLRNPEALDSYGGAAQDITNAYIVYALAEAGRRDMQPELDAAVKSAQESGDPYPLALAANALFCYDNSAKAKAILGKLIAGQAADGSWCGKRHSVTRSEGVSLKLETTALVCMAIMRDRQPDAGALVKGIKFILSCRSGSGGFGATQSTIMSLKALTQYAQFARKTDSPGTIVITVNGKAVAKKSYPAGQRDAIAIDSLERFLADKSNTIGVVFTDTKSALPYSIAVSYNTWQPVSSDTCKVAFTTSLGATTAKVGQTVRVSATLTNKTTTGLPMTMAIVGLPAGLSPQPWQLKELQEKKIVDFYEVSGSTVFFYYRQMKPSEERVINLDCKAEIPGVYTAPASRAYLYYTNEFKTWTSMKPIRIEG